MKESSIGILDELKNLSAKVDSIRDSIEVLLDMQKKLLQSLKKANGSIKDTEFIPDVLSLLSLPTSLRKTVLTLARIGEATSDEISKETNRKRAIESGYANQLIRLGYLDKRRVGRKVYFKLKVTIPERMI